MTCNTQSKQKCSVISSSSFQLRQSLGRRQRLERRCYQSLRHCSRSAPLRYRRKIHIWLSLGQILRGDPAQNPHWGQGQRHVWDCCWGVWWRPKSETTYTGYLGTFLRGLNMWSKGLIICEGHVHTGPWIFCMDWFWPCNLYAIVSFVLLKYTIPLDLVKMVTMQKEAGVRLGVCETLPTIRSEGQLPFSYLKQANNQLGTCFGVAQKAKSRTKSLILNLPTLSPNINVLIKHSGIIMYKPLTVCSNLQALGPEAILIHYMWNGSSVPLPPLVYPYPS